MKSFLVIGLGRFGKHLASELMRLGNDVMVVDASAATVEEVASEFTDSQISDCTNENVIISLGVEDFDICFVAIGEDFQSSLVITSLLKKHGAKKIVAKSNQNIQSDLLKKIGADEVVYPERDTASRMAMKYSAKNIYDYVPLNSDISICEMAVPASWVGKSVVNIDVRKLHGINIVSIKHENGVITMPGPDYVFRGSDHIVVIGKKSDVFKVSAKQ